MKTLLDTVIFADYCSFYLEDQDSTQDYEELSTDAGLKRMLSVGSQMAKIHTKVNGNVPVKVILYSSEPNFSSDACDYANEFSIEVTSSLLIGNTISDSFVELPVEPGVYRVRVLYVCININQYTKLAEYRYDIRLWPEERRRALEVLK
jgi:hypothetical protein